MSVLVALLACYGITVTVILIKRGKAGKTEVKSDMAELKKIVEGDVALRTVQQLVKEQSHFLDMIRTRFPYAYGIVAEEHGDQGLVNGDRDHKQNRLKPVERPAEASVTEKTGGEQ